LVDGEEPEIVVSLAREKSMKEFLPLLAILGLWFLLQMWILPRFGVST
jgi:hypothetical protein